MNAKTVKNRGDSLLTWTIVMAVMIASILVIRAPLKRSIQSRVTGVADYAFWRAWGLPSQQHKDDLSSKSKASSSQTQASEQTEEGAGFTYKSETKTGESPDEYISVSVEQGAEGLLKTIDLDK